MHYAWQAFDMVKAENAKSKTLTKKSMFTYAWKGMAGLFRKFVRAMRRAAPQSCDWQPHPSIAVDMNSFVYIAMRSCF